jgi:hypothetical protein
MEFNENEIAPTNVAGAVSFSIKVELFHNQFASTDRQTVLQNAE